MYIYYIVKRVGRGGACLRLARRASANRVFPVLAHDHLGPTDDKAYLEAYKYKKLKRGEDPVQRVLYEHSLTYQGLSYNKQD